MREEFQHISGGDVISASKHLNPLFDVAGRFARMHPGSHASGYQGTSFVGSSNNAPHYQNYVEIADLKIDPTDDDDNGLMLVYERYYEPPLAASELGEWKTKKSDTDPSLYRYLLDARELNNFLVLALGDVIPAWWHDQRQAFVPIIIPLQSLVSIATSDVPDGSVGTFQLVKVTPTGYSFVLDEAGDPVYKDAYNASGIDFVTGKYYKLESFRDSTILSAFPYQAGPC